MKALIKGAAIGGRKGGDGDNAGTRIRSGRDYIAGTGANSRLFKDRDPDHTSAAEAQRKASRRPGTPENDDANEGFDDRWAWDQRTALGANKRDVWSIPTQGYPGAHFATFPEDLAATCIKAGTSERGVCVECSAPYVRETELLYEARLESIATTTGWRPSCNHTGITMPAIVLDPFMGSGTTARVCIEYGRDFTGYEISPEYHRLIEDRLGFFYQKLGEV